jgi:site-specific recombinase XerC
VTLDTYQEAARIVREATKDKSYRAYPLGGEAGAYLRWKRGMITPTTYRDYEACLDKLARTFPDLELGAFAPPVGTERLEEFLEQRWGDSAPRTYNKNLSILKDFFKWAALKGKLHGDPTLAIVRHKKRDVHREVFNKDLRTRILRLGPDPDNAHRDRCLLHLLIKYGLRKGAIQHIQFKHFDHTRKRLTIFTKGGKIRDIIIVEPEFWNDLGRHIIEIGAEPQHFLLCRVRKIWRGYGPGGTSYFETKAYPETPSGDHGTHNWWYRCLARAGVTAEGQTSGERMHKARHSAGQRVVDATGNLKAAQRLLGHSDIATTGNVYAEWDADQMAETLRTINALEEE